MRKEWIRTDEERQLLEMKRSQKKQKPTEQPLQVSIVKRKKNQFPFDQVNFREQSINILSECDPISMPISTHRSWSKLTVDRLALINNIAHSYDQRALQWYIEPIQSYSRERSGLVQFVNHEERTHQSLIEFFKCIPEFRGISVNDQILFTKCNLGQSVHIHYILKYHFVEDTYIGSLMNFWLGTSFYSRIARTRRAYDCFQEHPIILKVSLVVMLFTINLCRLPERDLRYEFQD